MPRLDELLGASRTLRFNIDVKRRPRSTRWSRRSAAPAPSTGSCVASFSDRRLPAAPGRLGPRLCTSLGPRGRLLRGCAAAARWPAATAAAGAAARRCRSGAAGCAVIDRRFVAAAHRLGLQVHVWTINDPAEMHRLLDLGVDGIMTD